jgi:hypothetical protein
MPRQGGKHDSHHSYWLVARHLGRRDLVFYLLQPEPEIGRDGKPARMIN